MNAPKSLQWPNGQAVRWVVGITAALLTIMCSYVLGRVTLVREDLKDHEKLDGHATVTTDVKHLSEDMHSIEGKLDALSVKVEQNHDELIEQKVILQSIEKTVKNGGPH